MNAGILIITGFGLIVGLGALWFAWKLVQRISTERPVNEPPPRDDKPKSE